MFGRRFFGARFYGPRYWGDGGAAPAPAADERVIYAPILTPGRMNTR